MDQATVPEAARILGIKEESVRKRVSRGTLRSEKDETGRLLVWVDSTHTVRDEYADQSVTDRDDLVEELRSHIADLRSQLEAERESRRRADTIIAQLGQANAALAARVPELEPAEAAEEPAEGAADSVAMPAPAQADAGAQNATERPWWKFWS